MSGYEMSMGRNVHGTKCPWDEMSMGRNVRGTKCPWDEMSAIPKNELFSENEF